MTRVAAIDCGTNSVRLLVADLGDLGDLSDPADGGSGGLVDVHREMRIVRLGQGVDATGSFAPEAIERTRVALLAYAGTIADTGAERVRMVATSATRDAANRADFFAMVRDVLGVDAEVVTGDTEARLSFAGAVGELDPAQGPFLVVDLGGGSTELVLGDGDQEGHGVRAAFSADIGCVRLTERALPGDPPSAEQVATAERVAGEVLAAALEAVPVEQARTWVGVAGTFTTLAALAAGLPAYDSSAIHLARTPLERLHEVCDDVVGMTRAQRAELGPMHAGRVDVIGAGAVITRVLAREVAARAGITELVVSEHDILDGIALSLR